MNRAAANALIVLFMVVIAVAVAAAAARLVGADSGTTIAIGLAVLFTLALLHFTTQRAAEQAAMGRRLNDLARLEEGISRPLQLLASRIARLEERPDRHKPAEIEPVLAEVEVLGTLVTQLAESVADLQQRVDTMASARPLSASRLRAATHAPPALSEAAEPEPTSAAMVRAAVDGDRLEIHLQPIVTLPQRRARYYEALTRLRDPAGALVLPAEFLPVARREGLMPQIDNSVIFRTVQILRRLSTRQREIGLFCNLAAESLSDATFFGEFIGFAQANRALSEALIFELSQETVQACGPIEHEALGALTDLGFRLSMDQVSDLRMDFRGLAGRGFRFVKVSAGTMLRQPARGAADIVAADLSDMLARFGIDLIADRIETEAEVVDLLDYDIRFGQGNLFAPPRAVRAEALGAPTDNPAKQAATAP